MMEAILFTATADAAASQLFYCEVLGLQLVEDAPFATVYNINGTMFRVQKVERVDPLPYTALGFSVEDIEKKISTLSEKGVVFERYQFLSQDDLGIWTTPDGARIAWFKDPDGNVISLSQHQ